MTASLGDFLFGVALCGVAIQLKINQHRATLDRLPVFIDVDLGSAASRHTSDMSNNPSIYQTPGRDPHKGSDNSTPSERILAATGASGWRPENNRTGEILAWGGAYLNADAPFNWWLNSPPHRAIIEDGAYTHIGFSANHTNSANEWVYCVDFATSPPRPIFSKNSGRVIDVEGISPNSGAKIQQWDSWGGGNQRWRLENVGGGYALIRAEHSGKVLDVEGASTANGAKLVQWDWWGGDNQRFRPEVYGFGELKFTAKHSGKVLDVEGVSEANGARIQQWDWWEGPNQRWTFQTWHQ